MGFIGSGSLNQASTLQPGELRTLTLHAFTQDIQQTSYAVTFSLVTDNATDSVPLTLTIQQPQPNIVFQTLSVDPNSRITMARLTNNGATVTDLDFDVIQNTSGIPANVTVLPDLHHVYLPAGQSIDFQIIPLDLAGQTGYTPLPDSTRLVSSVANPDGSSKLTTAQQTLPGPFDGKVCAGKDWCYVIPAVCDNHCGSGLLPFSFNVTQPITNTVTSSAWYCTNKPNIDVAMRPSISIPPNASILSVSVSADFTPSGGEVYSHAVELLFNNEFMGGATVPDQSRLTLTVSPSAWVSGGAQTINLRSVHPFSNLSHYVVANNFTLTVQVSNYTANICAVDEQDARNRLGLVGTATPTPGPTPTAGPTPTPTPIPQPITAYVPCNRTAMLRETANSNGKLIAGLSAGTKVILDSAPLLVAGDTWYHAIVVDTGKQGYIDVRTASNGVYAIGYLENCSPSSAAPSPSQAPDTTPNTCTVHLPADHFAQTIDLYRYPLEGNPMEGTYSIPGKSSAPGTLDVDAYAVDEITNQLWFRTRTAVATGVFGQALAAPYNNFVRWFRVGSVPSPLPVIGTPDSGTPGTVDDGIPRALPIRVDAQAVSSPINAALRFRRPLVLAQTEIENCIRPQNGKDRLIFDIARSDSTNVTWDPSKYHLADPSTVPWNSWNSASILPWWPLSEDEQCLLALVKTRTYGLAAATGNAGGYGIPPKVHQGTDLFTRDDSTGLSAVYSVANNGIVVAMVQSEDGAEVSSFTYQGFSSAYWGDYRLVNGERYDFRAPFAVVVRYGQLFVVYAHVRYVYPQIHVGSSLRAGDAIGAIGLDPGGNPHLHIEIRSYGSSVSSSVFVHPNGDASMGANAWQILQGVPVYRPPSRQPVEPNLDYDITQFFGNNRTSVWTQDSDATVGQSQTNIRVSGLGGADGSLINIGFSCSLSFYFDNVHTKSDTWPSTNAAYRGFMYFHDTPATPYPPDQNPLLDPATSTTITP